MTHPTAARNGRAAACHARTDHVGRLTRLAHWCFQRKASATARRIAEAGLWDDWKQEIALAALEAEALGLEGYDALRFFGRRAHAALRDMGWRQATHTRLYGRREVPVAWDSEKE